jgi:TIR domain-containing protein
MAHDAFISYSNQDKATADAACTILESSGVRCWIAPRDVPPGSQWAGAIVDAIDKCKVIVLIFSSQANISNQIHREVERAVSKGIPIFPLRIEDVSPSSSMEYFLGSIHWLDALSPPLEQHLHRLAEAVRSYLEHKQNTVAGTSRFATPARAATGVDAGSQKAVPSGRHYTFAAAAIVVVIGAAATAALFYLKAVPGVPPTNQAVTAPVAQQPSQTASPKRQTVFNEANVRQLAEKQKIPLPPALVVIAPSSRVPDEIANVVGAWGGDQTWGGVGRNMILIVEDIDENAKATGIYAMGPPGPQAPVQNPPAFTTFSGQVTDEGLKFAWGSITYTFKRLPGEKIWGHLEGEVNQQHVENTIIVDRIN